ncbi:thioredoxin-dependent thiol peroxidase [Marivirga atlantica]|jgi:peroxiredoxin Q/BCP|uniref:thioredoxin-dependent peroxiredoxin n=1 Tax=Marivirga atlantica TaxID=1548457 RepID=A0A937ANG1_9BACT|nr:peroxiredoxin [Marivirga atlantica]MBL0766723.1 peroxiredoxin [Marivirga atlantica]
MPLQENQKAPVFSLPSTSGSDFNLKDYLGEPIILFFYPKDFTPGCTKEVCEFRDAFAEFRNLDVKVLGISQDSIESHHKFIKQHNLPFDLLTDKNGKVAKQYKATIPVIGMNRRVTYLLDKEHKIKGVFENMFAAGRHVEAMLQKL